MGEEPKVDGRSTEHRPKTNGRSAEHQPNTNRTPVGDQWEGIEHQWEGNGRKIGKKVKKKKNTKDNHHFFRVGLILFLARNLDVSEIVSIFASKTIKLNPK